MRLLSASLPSFFIPFIRPLSRLHRLHIIYGYVGRAI